MPASKSVATDLLELYLPEWRKNRDEIALIDRWYRGKLDESDKPKLPKKRTREYKELRDRSHSRWLALAVTVVAQALYVEGYRRKTDPDNAKAWKIWQANRLDARQIAIHRGALAHGLAYVTVLPGTLDNGESMPKVRGVSARRMVALYEDTADDEWPLYAVEGETIRSGGKKVVRFKLYDAEAIYTFDAEQNKLTYLDTQEHGAGRCPVVRYTNMLDLDGRSDGEVEPFIDMAARIDQATFDRQIVQRFGAWMLRWIAGMALPDDDEEADLAKLRLSMQDILVAEDPETKFGSFPATQLSPYIEAEQAEIKHFAAASQTPPHTLAGEMVNLSAEALAAAESGHTRKVTERKHSLGESHEQMFRLGAHLMGDTAGAADFEAQVRWADLESRSLAQVADALGKLATMLGVPPQALWERIPGVTQQDVERWKQLVENADPFTGLMAELNGAGGTSEGAEEAQVLKAKFDALGVAIRSGVAPEAAAKMLGLEGLTFTGAVPVSLRLPEEEAAGLEATTV